MSVLGGPVFRATSGGPVSSPGALGDESPAVVGDVVDGAGGVAADIEDGAGVGADMAPGSADGAGVGDASLTEPACAVIGVDVNGCITADAVAVAGGSGVVGRTGMVDAAGVAVGVVVGGSVTAKAAAVAGICGVADLACVADSGVAADAEVVVGVACVIGVVCAAVGVDTSGDLKADPIGGVAVGGACTPGGDAGADDAVSRAGAGSCIDPIRIMPAEPDRR